MGAVFGLAVVVYLLICGIFMGPIIYFRLAHERECEAAHNVYDCERIETWVPVVPQEGGE